MRWWCDHIQRWCSFSFWSEIQKCTLSPQWVCQAVHFTITSVPSPPKSMDSKICYSGKFFSRQSMICGFSLQLCDWWSFTVWQLCDWWIWCNPPEIGSQSRVKQFRKRQNPKQHRSLKAGKMISATLSPTTLFQTAVSAVNNYIDIDNEWLLKR